MNTVVACETCGLVQRLGPLGPGQVAECARCEARLADHRPNSLARTAAFSLAALLFYVPANIFPILQMELYGVHSENTVWQGCKLLFQRGEIMVALVVFGIFALLNLHTDEFPDIQQPVVGVTIVYPGASPSEVTREIIDPVEDAIFGISGVDGEKSTCSATDGLASCTIFFEFEKPIQQASQDIRDAISTKRADLPTEMEEPVLTRFDPSELLDYERDSDLWVLAPND